MVITCKLGREKKACLSSPDLTVPSVALLGSFSVANFLDHVNIEAVLTHEIAVSSASLPTAFSIARDAGPPAICRLYCFTLSAYIHAWWTIDGRRGQFSEAKKSDHLSACGATCDTLYTPCGVNLTSPFNSKASF